MTPTAFSKNAIRRMVKNKDEEKQKGEISGSKLHRIEDSELGVGHQVANINRKLME